MGQVALDEVEQLEIKNILLRQKLQQERIDHADTAKTLLTEGAALIANERELLLMRLITKYRLEGLEDMQLAPDGASIVFKGERPPEDAQPPRPSRFERLPDGTIRPLQEDVGELPDPLADFAGITVTPAPREPTSLPPMPDPPQERAYGPLQALHPRPGPPRED